MKHISYILLILFTIQCGGGGSTSSNPATTGGPVATTSSGGGVNNNNTPVITAPPGNTVDELEEIAYDAAIKNLSFNVTDSLPEVTHSSCRDAIANTKVDSRDDSNELVSALWDTILCNSNVCPILHANINLPSDCQYDYLTEVKFNFEMKENQSFYYQGSLVDDPNGLPFDAQISYHTPITFSVKSGELGEFVQKYSIKINISDGSDAKLKFFVIDPRDLGLNQYGDYTYDAAPESGYEIILPDFTHYNKKLDPEIEINGAKQYLLRTSYLDLSGVTMSNVVFEDDPTQKFVILSENGLNYMNKSSITIDSANLSSYKQEYDLKYQKMDWQSELVSIDVGDSIDSLAPWNIDHQSKTIEVINPDSPTPYIEYENKHISMKTIGIPHIDGMVGYVENGEEEPTKNYRWTKYANVNLLDKNISVNSRDTDHVDPNAGTKTDYSFVFPSHEEDDNNLFVGEYGNSDSSDDIGTKTFLNEFGETTTYNKKIVDDSETELGTKGASERYISNSGKHILYFSIDPGGSYIQYIDRNDPSNDCSFSKVISNPIVRLSGSGNKFLILSRPHPMEGQPWKFSIHNPENCETAEYEKTLPTEADGWGTSIYMESIEISDNGDIVVLHDRRSMNIHRYDIVNNEYNYYDFEGENLEVIKNATNYQYEYRSSIAISGDGNRIALGVCGKTYGSSFLYVLDFNSSNEFEIYYSRSGYSAYQRFGKSISISNDGNILAVGSAGGMGTEKIFSYIYDISQIDESGEPLTTHLIQDDSVDIAGLLVSENIELSGDGKTLIFDASPDKDIHLYKNKINSSLQLSWVKEATFNYNSSWDTTGHSETPDISDHIEFTLSITDNGGTFIVSDQGFDPVDSSHSYWHGRFHEINLKNSIVVNPVNENEYKVIELKRNKEYKVPYLNIIDSDTYSLTNKGIVMKTDDCHETDSCEYVGFGYNNNLYTDWVLAQ